MCFGLSQENHRKLPIKEKKMPNLPELEIRGFFEMSLIDWDGRITSVIFLPGCNFRCGFCHNSGLVLKPEALPYYSLEGILEYMIEHKDFIDGITVTGGEPTLQKNLPLALKAFKDNGFLIKLDTNGTNPEMLGQLINYRLVDYVAMDLKAPLLPEMYSKITGCKVTIDRVKESLEMLKAAAEKNPSFDYEIRTTVVPDYLGDPEILAMAQSLRGHRKWVLQQFVAKDLLNPEFSKITPYSEEKMQSLVGLAKRFVPAFGRGF